MRGNQEFKAWVHLDRDFAVAQARECDRSASRGPIHGVPFAAKDIMDTADLPTEYGSPIYKGNRPMADAACVALSRAAGGVLLGKTVTTEFASRSPLGNTTILTTQRTHRAVLPAALPLRSPISWCHWPSVPRRADR